MAEPNKREKYAYLDQLSTQRLRELLRADLESDGTEDNSEVIFHILEVMERRERGSDRPACRCPPGTGGI